MSTGKASSLRGILLAGAAALGLGMAATPAKADVVYLLNTAFSGDQPDTFLQATFSNAGADAVKLTLDYRFGTINSNEFIDGGGGFFFNSDPFTTLTFDGFNVIAGTVAPPTLANGSNAFQADGDGKFDHTLTFQVSGGTGRFNGGEAVELVLHGTGITETTFATLAAPGGGKGPFPVAAHVQGTSGPEGSGWITIPLPAAAWLFGPALLGLWGVSRRRSTEPEALAA
jgi:hypothetical protein